MSVAEQSVSSTKDAAVTHTTFTDNVAVRTVMTTESKVKADAENMGKMAVLLNKLSNDPN